MWGSSARGVTCASRERKAGWSWMLMYSLAFIGSTQVADDGKGAMLPSPCELLSPHWLYSDSPAPLQRHGTARPLHRCGS